MPIRYSKLLTWPTLCVFLLLTACSGVGMRPNRDDMPEPRAQEMLALDNPQEISEIVIFALGLLDTRYQFGGRNPEAGLDCSGMVSYVVEQVSGKRLPHNASQIARHTRPVELSAIRPGDLVFFNTTGKAYSHMGIYLGDERFIHAPSSKGSVRIDSIGNGYFAKRLQAARSLLAE